RSESRGLRAGWCCWKSWLLPDLLLMQRSPRSRFLPSAAARVLMQPAAEVREGDAVTLTCEAARPAATYAWYKNGRQLPRGSAATLLFPSVGAEDAGAFHCQTSSGDTAAPVSLRVLLDGPWREPGRWGGWHGDMQGDGSCRMLMEHRGAL
uniref:Ig-like domain-containing protein n=1 Tax=Nothoprocta perdicaria TaxID=30464 RepID=A0A8C6ZE96_NOTPE